MAIVIEGKTRCGICGQPIEGGQETVAFPAFLPKHHHLAPFSDAAFHKHCFESAAEAPKVRSMYEKYRAIWSSRPADLRGLAEIEAWGRKAFRDFPGDE